MRRLWLPVTILGWLFIAVGCTSLVRSVVMFAGDLSEARNPDAARHGVLDLVLAAGSGVLAATGGTFLLRGRNWARWLCATWMGAHVVLSLLHTLAEVLVHGAIFAAVVLVLWHPRATAALQGRAT